MGTEKKPEKRTGPLQSLRAAWFRLVLVLTNPAALSEQGQKDLAKTKKTFLKIIVICVILFVLVLVAYALASSVNIYVDGQPVWGPAASK